MWKARITAKTLIQLLAKKKKETTHSHHPWLQKFYLQCHHLQIKIDDFAVRKFLWLHSHRFLIILLMLYFLIWHPGLGLRPLPQPFQHTNSFTPSINTTPSGIEMMRMSATTGRLEIIRPGKKIRSYLASSWNIEPGVYVATSHSSIQNHSIQIQEKNTKITAWLLEAGHHTGTNSGDPFITFDEANWAIIYPYLQQNIPLVVR